MKTLNTKISLKAYARIAGLLYLLIAISGGFSIGYVPSVILVPGDAAATAQQVAENMGLFRLGIAADIAVLLMEVILTVMLYRLFKPVSQTMANIAAFSRIGMSIVMALNLLNYLIPIQLLSGNEYLSVFDPAQLNALALVFFDAHQMGVFVWGLFFGLHMMALGYLLFTSGYVPKALGVLVGVGSLGYLGEAILELTSSNTASLSMIITGLLVIAVVGELSFTFWLLIKGVNNEK